MTKNEEEAEDLKYRLQQATGLKFTIEKSSNGSMPFLDVLVTQAADKFNTQVYTKPTNPGLCLNGRSECPQKYKDSTIGAYIRRALTHSSTWEQVHQEIERITQVLNRNGFNVEDISRQTKRIIDKWYNNKQEEKEKKEEIKIYYKAFFSTAYKEDERIMKEIIKRNIKPIDDNKQVKLIIYYKTKKTSQLLLRNSPQAKTEELQKSHVVYRFTCNKGNCEVLPSTYIGMTTTRLSRRLTFHLTSGAPRKHLQEKHGRKITRKILEENTTIITSCQDTRRLSILEALHIKKTNPALNIQQYDLQALPSLRTFTVTADAKVVDVASQSEVTADAEVVDVASQSEARGGV